MAAGLLLTAGVISCVDDLDVLGPVPDDAPEAPAGPRPSVIYRFDEGAGSRVLDSSRSGGLLHLTIEKPENVMWQEDGLVIEAPTRIVSDQPATAFLQAVKQSGQITIEAWVTPAPVQEAGTVRIVGASRDQASRNFTLGIGGLFNEGPLDAYVLRLRVSGAGISGNGLPALSTGPGQVTVALTHIVATHDGAGKNTLYVNGAAVAARVLEGAFGNWDTSFPLVIGDELGSDDPRRAFRGTMHLIALYAVALTPEAVKAHHAAGPSW